MELIIYPYKISKRTEYSKSLAYNIETNENISEKDNILAEKIIKDYNKQLKNSSDFFEMDGNTLINYRGDYDKDVQYVFIPEGVEEIGVSSFNKEKIKAIHFPSSLKRISNNAFVDCFFLEVIDVPSHITEIRWGAFYNCFRLKKINLPPLLEISSYLFSNCESLENITLPDTVYELGKYSFYNCVELTDIKLSKELRIIKNNAFNGCIKLSKIDLPDGLQAIDSKAFRGCVSLKEMAIPDSVSIILEKAFADCKGLVNIKLSESLKSLPYRLFEGCDDLRNVILPDGIEVLHQEIFKDTPGIKRINVPKNLNILDGLAFANSSIRALIFNHDLPSLKYKISPAFGKRYDLLTNTKINTLIIKNSVNIIDPEAFKLSGAQIKRINYHGTKEEFESFKKNNKELFLCFKDLKEIKFIEEKTKEPVIEKADR